MGKWRAIILIISSMLITVKCYDTGHHNDLTRNGLKVFNYSSDCLKIVPLANWFVDYLSYTYDTQEKQIPLNLLHFDNVYSFQDTVYYWDQLVLNTKSSVQNFTRANDVLSVLMLMGATLHAVQDFYTHSSWTKIYDQISCSCYRSSTYFSVLKEFRGNFTDMIPLHRSLSTYSYGGCSESLGQLNCRPGTVTHGDYCEGLNKDSYVRPFWEQSYGMAFAASVEWIYNIEQWVSQIDPNFVKKMRTFGVSGEDASDLNDNYQSAYVISYSIQTFVSENGHWKGPGSGGPARFLVEIGDFITSSSVFKDRFIKDKIYEGLVNPSPYLASDVRGATQSKAIEFVIPFSNMTNYNDFVGVKVRTTYVRAKGPADPYATVIIDGMEFIESVQMRSTEFNPHWTSIYFVNASHPTVDVVYTLMDDEFPESDDIITLSRDHLVFTVNITSHNMTGDIQGIYDSSQKVYNSTDSSNSNSVSLFVTSRKMTYSGDCGAAMENNPFPVPFCEDEAYTELGIHKICQSLENEQKASTGGLGQGHTLTPSLLLLFILLLLSYPRI